MYAVFVEIKIKPGLMKAFLPRMLENARASRLREPGCEQFDVCAREDRPDEVFLYEVYTSAEAFAEHLKSLHFQAFDAETADMIADKTLRTGPRLAPD